MTVRRIVRSVLGMIFLVLAALPAFAAPIPSEIKSVVVFVLIEVDGKLTSNGTAFFVGVKDQSQPGVRAVYLVTSRHVLYKPKTKECLDKVFLRINTKDGGSEIKAVPLVLKGEGRTVFFHPEASVDLAVIPMFPEPSKYDFKYLPDDFLTTKTDYDKLHIREGTDIFFTGLFMQYPGAQKNHPIVRFGRVALVTDEKIEWDGQQMDLYLIEAASYGGNSGSPVFFYLGNDREPGNIYATPPVIKLAGVMQGTFLDIQEIRAIDTARVPISVASMGIAAVVPAYKLKELLDADLLKQIRGF